MYEFKLLVRIHCVYGNPKILVTASVQKVDFPILDWTLGKTLFPSYL